MVCLRNMCKATLNKGDNNIIIIIIVIIIAAIIIIIIIIIHFVLYMRGGSSVTHENSQFLFPGCISIQFVR